MCARLTGKRVLIADDEESARSYLSAVMRAAGARTAEVRDGHAALESLSRGEADLAVIDVHMPGKGGMDVLRERENDTTPVILVSGQGSVTDAVEAMRLGAADYLTKPIPMADLLGRASQAVERSLSRLVVPPSSTIVRYSVPVDHDWPRCRQCDSRNVFRSAFRGLEPLFLLLLLRPFRCQDCHARMWRMWGAERLARAGRLLRYILCEHRWASTAARRGQHRE